MTFRGLIATISVLAFFAVASSASAGTYVVQACGTGANNSWTLTSTTTKLESGATCPATSAEYGGLWVRDVLASGGPFSDATGRGWQFSAPAGLTVSALTARYWLHKRNDDDLQPQLRTGSTVLAGCTIVSPAVDCSSGSMGGATVASFSGLVSPSLWVGVRCDTGDPMVTCGTGGTIHAARAVLYSAAVTVNDPSAPTVGAVTGSLAGGAWRRGVQTLGVGSASDAAGVRRLRVFQGGTQRGELARSCDYTLPRPCSDAPSGELVSVDTSAIADGERQLEVGVFDAAENETRSAPVTVRVDNTAPAAPEGLAIAQGAITSVSQVDASWSLPGGQASPIVESRWELCELASSSCRTGSTSSTSLSEPVAEGRQRLRVWLVDEAGNSNPAGAAEREVLVDRSAPASPEGLAARVASGPSLPSAVTVSWANPPASGSPIAAALWEVCAPSGSCLRGETSATTFSFDAVQEGTYGIRVWLRDEAGNVSETTAASTSALVRLSPGPAPTPTPTPAPAPAPAPTVTPTPAPTPAPTVTPSPTRPSARVDSVSARRARSGRVTVRVRGRHSVSRGRARVRVQIGSRVVTRTVTAARSTRRLALDLTLLAPRGTRAIVRVTPIGGRAVSRTVMVRKLVSR